MFGPCGGRGHSRRLHAPSALGRSGSARDRHLPQDLSGDEPRHSRAHRGRRGNPLGFVAASSRATTSLSMAGQGVDAAANAAPEGAAVALATVRDGGRLVTITSDPPESERGIEVVSLYVRADGEQLAGAGHDLVAGRLDFELGASFPLAEADAALARVVEGGGTVALEV